MKAADRTPNVAQVAEGERPVVQVRLRTRASRSRKRTEETVEVEAPRTREGQINQLSSMVEERFPGAKLRVFHEGAGSFTRDDLHIVAAYQNLHVLPPVDTSGSQSTEQDVVVQQLRLTA